MTKTYKHEKVKNYAGKRRFRSSKKDRAKNKQEREWDW